MNCGETQLLLDANADGELDLVRHVELEDHLKACPACLRRFQGVAARRARIRDTLSRFHVSQLLRESIDAALRTEAQKAAKQSPIGFPFRWPHWKVVGVAASIAVALLAGYSWGSHRTRSASSAGEAFDKHVRSLQANHLMEVISTDRHTAKP